MFYPKLMETGRSGSGKYVLIQASETSCAPWADPLSQQGGLGFTTMSLSPILTTSVEHYPCKSINPQLDSGNTIFNHRRVSIMAEDVLVLLAPGHLQLTQACRCIYRETQRNIPQRGNQRNVIASTQNDVFFREWEFSKPTPPCLNIFESGAKINQITVCTQLSTVWTAISSEVTLLYK